MKSISNNDTGIAYGHVVVIIEFFAVMAAFVLVGVVVDVLEDFILSTNITYSSTLLDRVDDLGFSYSKIPLMLVLIMFVFIIIRSLKRGAEYQ